MTKEDQIGLVCDMCDRMKMELVAKIERGKIPDSWDGHELRQLLADNFADCTSRLMQDKRSYRRRDYENVRLTANLMLS